jgi:phosphoglycerol transferase MdoB-like AlkP superfamily enzyme
MAMMAAVLVCLTASVAGTLPLWRARHLPPAHTVSAQLAAMALRLGVVAVLAVAIATAGLVPLPAFLLWLAIAHAGLLFADTAFARSIIRFTEVRSAANASTGSDPKEPQEP